MSRVPVFHSRNAFALLALILSGSSCRGVRGAPVDMDPNRAVEVPPAGLSAFADFPLTRTMITRTTVTTAVTGQTPTTLPLLREDTLIGGTADNVDKSLSVQTPDQGDADNTAESMSVQNPDQGDAIDELERDVIEWKTGKRPSGPLVCKGACDRRELLLLVIIVVVRCHCCFCCPTHLSML